MTKQRGLILLGVGLAFVLLAAGGYFIVVRPLLQAGATPEPTTAPSIVFTPPASLDELATQYPEYADILTDPELDSAYKDFLIAYQTGGEQAAAELARRRGLLDRQDRVRFTLVLDTDDPAVISALTAAVKARGAEVVDQAGAQIKIAIPLAVIQAEAQSEDPGATIRSLTGLEHVIRVKLPTPADIKEGRLSPALAEVEGVHVTGADLWHAAGLTGQGIKVGVLDLGFDGYPGLLGTALPAQVTAESFVPGVPIDQSGEVHGAAVAEIVHAMAPDAELYLAMFDDDTSWLNAIDWLLSNGVQIISHSAGWEIGPMDGTYFFAQIVDQVTAQDVIWVNAAGNEAEQHYRGVFSDGDGDGFHEFPDGEPVMAFEVYEPYTRIFLNWDDWESATQDLDLYLFDELGNLLASSEDYQSGQEGQEPLEVVVYGEFTEPSVVFLAVKGAALTRAVTMDIFVSGYVEWPVPDHSLSAPSDARTSLTVGAVDFFDDQLTSYSSQGPTADGRLKPEISAPTHVSTESYGPQEFDGTSSSTPHVSGAAALVWSAHPEFSADQVKQFLLDNALDLGPSGPDNGYGTGRLRLPAPEGVPAEQATEIAQEPVPTAAAPVEQPGEQPVQQPGQPPAGGQGQTSDLTRVLLPAACALLLLCGCGFMAVGLVAFAGFSRRPKSRAAQPRPSGARARPGSQSDVATARLGDQAGFGLRLPGGQMLPLRPPETTLGRAGETDLTIAASEISREHARFTFEGGRWSVTDLGSTNGTLVNGQRLSPGEARALSPGDRVKFGGVTGVEVVFTS